MPQLLSLHFRAHEPQLLSSYTASTEAHIACAPQQEKPPQGEAHAPQLEKSPHSPQLEKNTNSNEDLRPQKSTNFKKKKEEKKKPSLLHTSLFHTRDMTANLLEALIRNVLSCCFSFHIAQQPQWFC